MELSEGTLALMDSSDPLDGDMWEEVEESVLLQDFLEETDSSRTGHSSSGMSDDVRTQDTPNSLEIDSKPVAPSQGVLLDGAPKPERRAAQRFTPHELDILKAFFLVNPMPPPTAKKMLAEQLSTSTKRISTWYADNLIAITLEVGH